MFAPVYTISNKILSGLINLEVNRKIVDLGQLQSDWETRLRQESLARRAFSLTHFIGNSLSFEDISKIVRDEPGRDDKASDVAMRTNVVGKENEIQQILNFLNTNSLVEQVAYLVNKFKQTDYGERDLQKINTLLGERLMPMADLGIYRQTDKSEMALHVPLAVEVPYQIHDLFNWFISSGKEIHPVLKAGIMLYELIRIEPFSGNDTLTAVSFCCLVLACEGCGFKKLWSPEEELLKNRDNFWNALLSVEKNGGDLTVWLEYFSRAVDEASEKTKIKIINLLGEMPIFKSEGGRVISLTERQIGIMEEMTVRNEMTIKEIRNILPMVSDDTILRDLKDLMDKKLIKKKGKTKGAVYQLGKVKSFK